MSPRSGSRHYRIRTASLVVLGAVACDLGVEPPPDTPLLALSAREVSLFVTRGSEVPDEAVVQISNNGRGTLSGLDTLGPIYAGEPSGWLRVTLQDTTLTLTARAVTEAGDTLGTGAYQAQVNVLADEAANSPRTITVDLLVGESEQISLSVGKLTFAAQATHAPPPRQMVTISNAGDGVLSELALDSIQYRIGEPGGWLDTLLLDTLAPTGVELWPNSVPQQVGTFHATVFLGSRIADPSSDSIQVEYVVAPPPTLVLSATSLELESVEGDMGLLVHEIALRELNGRPLAGLTDSVPPGQDWLTSRRDTSAAPAILTIQVDPKDFVGDTVYQDTVFVSSSAGDVEKVGVSVRVRRGPTLHLSMDTVRFTMNPTDPPPGVQRVRIENSGAGTLSGLDVPSPQPAPWLTASLTATTAPSDLVLQVVSAAGTTDTALVEVAESGGGTDTVAVVLEMLPGPTIVLSSDSVTFRSDGTQVPPPLTVWLANDSTGVLSGLTRTVDPLGGPSWLNANLNSTTAGTTLLLQVISVPAPPDTYPATVDIGSSLAGVSTVSLPVVFEVAPVTATDAAIGLSSDEVLLRYVKTEAIPEVILGVENLGSRAVTNLEVKQKPDWLDTAFVGGVDPPTTLRLTLVPSELGGLNPPLTDVVRISAQATGGPKPADVLLPVTLQVAGPEMVVTSDSVVFRAYEGQDPLPDPQNVTVSNRGSGTLQGVYASPGSTWLSVVPSSQASALPAPAVIEMRPNTARPAPQLNTQVEVFGESASSLQFQVGFEIDPGPNLKLASDNVRLSSVEGSTDPEAVTVALYNDGNGPLGALLPPRNSQQWLTAAIDSSVVPARLVLTARADTLSGGTYPDIVRVEATSGTSADLAVTFTVAPQPEIQVSPEALVFHADALVDSVPAAQTFTVFDPAGGPSGQVDAASDAAWLDVDVDSTMAPVRVVVRPKDVLESSGSPYVDSVRVESTLGTSLPQWVHVTYNIDVGRDPVINLSTDRLEFRRPTSASDVVAAQEVEITNGGSRTLRELSVADSTAGGPVDWLFVLLDSRVAPATLTVSIISAEASTTQRGEATLWITGEGAEPRRLIVVLR